MTSANNVLTGKDSRRQRMCRALAIVITLMVVGVFLRAGNCGFVWDDDLHLLDNPAVAGGLTWRSAAWALTTTYGANWQPLTWLSHLTDISLFGFDPRWHHLANVAWHLAVSILLFAFLRNLTGACVRSALAAALFAVHPLRVESVAWVSERKDVLSAFFFMLTLAAWLSWTRRRTAWRYITASICFILGLSAKSMLVTLPFVLLLLDFWPLGRWRLVSRKTLIGEKAPLFALSAAVAMITYAAQSADRAVSSFPIAWRLSNAALSVIRYLGLTFRPVNLAFFYPHPLGSSSRATILACCAALTAITITVLALRCTRPYLFTGWFWFTGMLVPVLGIVQVGRQAMADRYTYLPHIGLTVLMVWWLADLVRSSPRLTVALIGTAVFVVSALGVIAARQVSVWKDAEMLYRQALSVTRGNYVAHYNLGEVLQRQGRDADAVSHYREALAIRRDYPDALNNLGYLIARQGRLQEAADLYRESLRYDPDSAEAASNLGVVLARLGRTDEARAFLSRAVRLAPGNYFYRSMLEQLSPGSR